jgi:phage baseplate assembly protein gpV
MSQQADVSDHAVLRYLERAHRLDVEAVRRHLAGLTVTAVRLGAIAVTVENVKLVLKRNAAGDRTVVTTTIMPSWPSRRGGGAPD